MYRNKKRVNIYKEELIARTWHPELFMDWCLDDDEKDELGQYMNLVKI